MRARAGDITQAMRLAAFTLGVTLFLAWPGELADRLWTPGRAAWTGWPAMCSGPGRLGRRPGDGLGLAGGAHVAAHAPLPDPADPLAMARHAVGLPLPPLAPAPWRELVNNVGLILVGRVLIAFALTTLA